MIYFVQSGASPAIKIGTTVNINTRMRELQRYNPEKLNCLLVIHGGHGVEQILHSAFRADHIHCEWYRFSPQIVEAIAKLRDMPVSEIPKFATALQSVADLKDQQQVQDAKNRIPKIEESLKRAVQVAVERFGKKSVSEAMGIGVRSVRNVLNGQTLPSGKSIFNLALLDPGLIDGVINSLGFALRPIGTARIAREGVA